MQRIVRESRATVRTVRRSIFVVSASVVLVVLVVFFFLGARSELFGPVPSMSLVPRLPDDIEVVRNETEYSDGAGGNSARVLVLRSARRSPAEVADEVAQAFDSDPAWRADPDGARRSTQRWQQPPHGCENGSSVTSASVAVSDPGEEIEVGQFNTFKVDNSSAILRVSTLYHAFCSVGSSIGS